MIRLQTGCSLVTGVQTFDLPILNYAKTLSRPSFGQRNPGLSYVVSYVNTIQNSGSGGNPDLRPQKADSFDASLEYYFGRSNYVSAVAFYRDITDRIINGTEVRTLAGLQYVTSTHRHPGSAKIGSEERRVGNECGRKCRARWCTSH